MSISFTSDKNSTLIGLAEHGSAINKFVKGTLSEKQIFGLCGAPDGATVTIKGFLEAAQEQGNPPWTIEDIPPGIFFEIKHEAIVKKNEVILYNDEDNYLAIYIKLVDFHQGKTGPKAGARLVDKIASTMKAFTGDLLFSKIRLMAAGGRQWPNRENGRRWLGYVIWPKSGFDMELHESTLRIMKEFAFYPRTVQKIEETEIFMPQNTLSDCKTVQDVLGLEEGGGDFWAAAGDGVYMEFDLQSEKCNATLKSYLQEGKT